MSKTDRRTKRHPQERELPERAPICEPEPLDEFTQARLKRDFDLSDYPLARREDLVVTPEGRVLIAGGSLDDLVTVGAPLTPPLRLV